MRTKKYTKETKERTKRYKNEKKNIQKVSLKS